MSSRSKVVIAIRYSVWEKISGVVRDCLDEADELLQKPEGFLFIFDEIRWPIVLVEGDINSSDPCEQLVGFLKTQPESDYLVVEACYDYPDSDDGDMGKWTDNPWDIRRVVSVDILFNEQ